MAIEDEMWGATTGLLSVSRREFYNSFSNRIFLLILVGFIVVGLMPMSLSPTAVETLGGAASLGDVQPTVGLLVPLIAAALGYRAVIGERESGTIRILAGTRLSRAEIVLGKTLGRSLTTLLFVVPGVCLVTIVDILRYGAFAPVTALGFFVLLSLYILAVTTIVVSLSTLASSSVQASVLVFITAIAGLLLWSDVVVAIVWNLLTGTVPGNELRYSNAFEFVTRLSPNDAYYVLSNWLLGAPIGTDSAASQIAETARMATAGTGSAQPIYLTPWFSFVPLVGWPIGLLSVAIWRFDHESLAIS